MQEGTLIIVVSGDAAISYWLFVRRFADYLHVRPTILPSWRVELGPKDR